MVRFHIMISGMVQGVGFRRFTRRRAKQYEIAGWVRNKENGTVEIVAEGMPDKIEEFLKAVQKGPKRSIIEKVEIRQEQVLEHYQGFVRKD